MGAYRHLLCATDFSDSALVAVGAAGRLAQKLAARVTLVHVVDTGLLVPGLDMAAGTGDPRKQRAAQTKKQLDELRAAHFADPKTVDAVVTVAKSPAAGVIEQQKTSEADLVVIGTQGRTGLARLMVGSVAEQVVRGAACDVMSVGPRSAADAPLSGAILVGTDFSEEAHHAFATAKSLARALGSEIILCHVHDPEVPVAGKGGRLASRKQVTELLRTALEAERAEHFGDIPSRAELAENDDGAADGMCKLVEQKGIGLVVTASHGRTGLAQLLIGSVAERLVRLAPCPVLTVRVTPPA
jgi:nucleotide-binding universal stress UspA family protein